jgi:hypothetical protein
VRTTVIALVGAMCGVPVLAHAAAYQVAIVFDRSDYGYDGKSIGLSQRMRSELDAFQQGLGADTVELALMTCEADSRRGPVQAKLVRPFGPMQKSIADEVAASMSEARPPCAAGVDLVEEARTALKWSDGAEKRIVVLSTHGHFAMNGRTTAETLMHRLEHEEIVFHAVETFRPRSDFYWSMMEHDKLDAVAGDVRTFLEKPTAPLGRVPSWLRHATSISGGSYQLAMIPAPQDDGMSDLPKDLRDRAARGVEETRGRQRALLKRAYAKLPGQRDGLDDLAEGRRRPSEVKAGELPEALRHVDLEPLLDAVWDFVDARQTYATFNEESDGRAAKLGAELAKAVLGRRRLPPSRR